MRMVGLKTVTMCFLSVLAFLGFFEAYVGLSNLMWQSQDGEGEGLPNLTSVMLLACAAVQFIASGCGLCGFKKLQKGAIRWASLILGIACMVLLYVSISTYRFLRDREIARPENVLIVLAIAMVADFFMVCTLAFMNLYFWRVKRLFKAKSRAKMVPIQYSDYDQRMKARGKKPGPPKLPKPGKRPKEFLPRNAL